MRRRCRFAGAPEGRASIEAEDLDRIGTEIDWIMKCTPNERYRTPGSLRYPHLPRQPPPPRPLLRPEAQEFSPLSICSDPCILGVGRCPCRPRGHGCRQRHPPGQGCPGIAGYRREDLDVAGAIRTSKHSWICPFTGLSPRCFCKLVTAVQREDAAEPRTGRPWDLTPEDRVLLVAAYWRTNLTIRQLSLLFGMSKSEADRIINHIGPLLALPRRRQFARGTVLIVDGMLVPTRDYAVAEQSKNYRYSPITRSSSMPTPAWSLWSVGPCQATGTTAWHGRNRGPRQRSAGLP